MEMYKRPTKTKLIEELTHGEKSYTELKNKLGISDPVLQGHLKDLRRFGWIDKDEHGLYILTEAGRLFLQEIKLKASAEESFSVPRNPVPPEKAALLGTLYTYFFGGPTSPFDTYLDRIHRATLSAKSPTDSWRTTMRDTERRSLWTETFIRDLFLAKYRESLGGTTRVPATEEEYKPEPDGLLEAKRTLEDYRSWLDEGLSQVQKVAPLLAGEEKFMDFLIKQLADLRAAVAEAIHQTESEIKEKVRQMKMGWEEGSAGVRIGSHIELGTHDPNPFSLWLRMHPEMSQGAKAGSHIGGKPAPEPSTNE